MFGEETPWVWVEGFGYEFFNGLFSMIMFIGSIALWGWALVMIYAVLRALLKKRHEKKEKENAQRD